MDIMMVNYVLRKHGLDQYYHTNWDPTKVTTLYILPFFSMNSNTSFAKEKRKEEREMDEKYLKQETEAFECALGYKKD